jgi:hypothetical protein
MSAHYLCGRIGAAVPADILVTGALPVCGVSA